MGRTSRKSRQKVDREELYQLLDSPNPPSLEELARHFKCHPATIKLLIQRRQLADKASCPARRRQEQGFGRPHKDYIYAIESLQQHCQEVDLSFQNTLVHLIDQYLEGALELAEPVSPPPSPPPMVKEPRLYQALQWKSRQYGDPTFLGQVQVPVELLSIPLLVRRGAIPKCRARVSGGEDTRPEDEAPHPT